MKSVTSPGDEADAPWFSGLQVCRFEGFDDSFLKFSPFFSDKRNLKCLVVARQEGEEFY